ncbi:MAG: DnaA regulatory inactivator Hda [Betaproteobacteria bacterium]|nr:DnaA regulatory inactivator Hda [Betaproteobacteria bacterium]
MRQLALDLAHSPPPTLENFVPGRNAELLQCLRQLSAESAGERFIYVWGLPGSGRTHLLRGLVSRERERGRRAAYIACTRETVFDPATGTADCVAADDVERLGTEAQLALFRIYNELRERRGALLASGDRPPARLDLRPDLVTRLGWGLVYEVHALSDDEKVRALRRHAQARGAPVPEEVFAYLLSHAQRDMPTLMAVLDALDRRSLEAKRPITVTLVREFLQADGIRD